MAARLQHRIALITGAGSGIGRATAHLFAQEGATAIVSDLDLAAAERVAGEITSAGRLAESVHLDVTQESQWRELLQTIPARHGRLDVLVNNAAISFAAPVADMSWDQWRRVMAVNLDSVFLGTHHGIAAMRSTGGGSIVNVASVSGIHAYPEASAYGASKAAVRLFSRVAAMECADAHNGVRVNVVTPGGVKTPMWESMPFFQQLAQQHGGTEQAFAAMAGPAGSQQFFSAEEVAATILFLAADESAHLNGVELIMSHGHVA